jgi:predicted dehydrogenase
MKIINTALCSFGMSGSIFHAPFIAVNPGFNLYAVYERSEKKAHLTYPDCKSFDSLDDMLDDENIELVVVNTPNYTHFEFAKKALLAGKHVLVEKAFTVTADEARELIKIAVEVNKVVCVYQNRRYDSDFRTVRKIVDSNKLGDIVEAEIHFDRYKLEPNAKKHKEEPLPGSGLLHDLGPHIIDPALLLFGMPDSIYASVRMTRPGSQVNDYFDALLMYPQLNVRLKSSLIVREVLPAFVIHGTTGSFLKLRADIQEDKLKEGAIPGSAGWGVEDPSLSGTLTWLDGDVWKRDTIIAEAGNYMKLYEDLYDAIANGGKVPVPGADGLKVMQIIEAILESAKDKKMVRLN